MKLRVGKKRPEQQGRMRANSVGRAPNAYSYHAQRANRPEATTRKQIGGAQQRSRLLSLQFWMRRSGMVVAAIVLLICLITVLSLNNQPRMVLLDEGNTYAFRQAEVYEAAASKALSSSIWNRNKITVSTGGIASSLKKQFPELAEVNVTLPLVGRRPIIYLQANSPAFVMQSVNGSFVIDNKGKALIAKDGVPESTANSLPTITDQTGNNVEIGKQVLSSSNVAFIQTVLGTLAEKSVSVESLTLPARNVQQLHVRVGGKPYFVKFDMHQSGGARQQVGTYLATAKNLESRGVTPAQYIDVRVLGRAYYQ